MGKKKNLTIRKLPELIADEKLKDEASKIIDTALEKSEKNIRDRRNRHIAHIDLQLVIETEKVEPLKPISRRTIKEALSAISDVLNAISKHYYELEVGFKSITFSGGVNLLLCHLGELDI